MRRKKGLISHVMYFCIHNIQVNTGFVLKKKKKKSHFIKYLPRKKKKKLHITSPPIPPAGCTNFFLNPKGMKLWCLFCLFYYHVAFHQQTLLKEYFIKICVCVCLFEYICVHVSTILFATFRFGICIKNSYNHVKHC